MSEPRGTERVESGWDANVDDLMQVLRCLADPITVQGPDGRLVFANEAAARQIGYESADALMAAPLDDVMGRYRLIDEQRQPLPRESLPGRRALRGEAGPAALVGFRVRDQPGERWAVVKASPILDERTVRFVVNTFQDVTERKRTEDRLRLLADAGAAVAATTDYEAALQSLAETVVMAVADWCVVDIVDDNGVHRAAVAHPDARMRSVVEELERRYPPDPQQGGAVATVISSGEPLILPEVSDEMLRARATDDKHLELLRRLGLRSVAILPLVARGQVLGAMTLAGAESGHQYSEADRTFLLDLAGRAALAVDNSRLLHESQEALRLRDDFLAMASHDMRTPLQAILGNVQLARRRLARLETAGNGTDELARNLLNAERTTGKLARLVGELMDVAMIRSRQSLPLDLVETDLVPVLRQLADEHRARAQRHTIQVRGEPVLVGTWDTGRLERVLDNLVDNAVKYSPDGGTVAIDARADDDEVTISVRDEGIGIPASDLGGIFQPYRRGSNATMLRGIGLGLAGCRQVLEQLGGTLSVESTEGSGSTFSIRLPRSGTRPGA